MMLEDGNAQDIDINIYAVSHVTDLPRIEVIGLGATKRQVGVEVLNHVFDDTDHVDVIRLPRTDITKQVADDGNRTK
jgi:hypothetical protein